jgi:Domain of unknown function (DUF1906)
MQDWWDNTPSYWTGFYLAPAPNHADTSWMNKRATLDSIGWGFGILYLGRQAGDSVHLTAAQGRTDAQNAAALTAQAGFSLPAHVFLDVETGGVLTSKFITYITAWVQEVFDNTIHYPGVYCNKTSATQIKNAVTGTPTDFWVASLGCPPSQGCGQALPAPGPTLSGISFALAWQYAESGLPGGCPGFNANGNCDLVSSGTHYPVDLDVATRTDPAHG